MEPETIVVPKPDRERPIMEHPSLVPLKVEEAVQPIVLEPQVDLSRLKEKAQRIVESVNRLVLDAEVELDAIEADVLRLVKQRLEKK